MGTAALRSRDLSDCIICWRGGGGGYRVGGGRFNSAFFKILFAFGLFLFLFSFFFASCLVPVLCVCLEVVFCFDLVLLLVLFFCLIFVFCFFWSSFCCF